MKRGVGILVAGAVVGGGIYAVAHLQTDGIRRMTSTGKFLSPVDPGVDVGSYPVNLALSPDGKFIVATNSGYRQQLSVLDASNGHLVSKLDFNKVTGHKQALYFGIAFGPDGLLYASRGVEDKVSAFRLTPEGQLEPTTDISDPSPDKDKPNFLGGIAFGRSGLFVAHNESYPGGDGNSAVAEIDVATRRVKKTFTVGGFPLGVATLSPGGVEKIYATSERDGFVASIAEATGTVIHIPTGKNPSHLFTTPTGELWVSNSGSDTISRIDPKTDRVAKTILVRPAEMRGLPSCTPLGMDTTGGNLFVACADLNAIAVIDEKSGKLRGYIPVGWCPTAVKVTQDGKRLFVANAKGHAIKTPNGKAIAGKGTYILSVMEGTVSMVDIDKALNELPALSKVVVANNRFDGNREKTIREAFKNPGIKHVIYVIRENRTYDNIMGDNPRGNGDPSICLFPKDVTPNYHALADRFGLYDNFNVCAEVSFDGWEWSTSGMVNEYISRNVPTNYSGRGRDYDGEGETNGDKADLRGKPDVAEAPGGFIWDLCRRSGVSMRNYGFFVGETNALGARPGTNQKRDTPNKRALMGITDDSFREFDMQYPDSEGLAKYGFSAPKQMKAFGAHNSPSRIAEWRGEFDQYVKNGNLPHFMMMRLPRDHTSGTSTGLSSPRAMVADNDYAIGQLVEAISHSPYWSTTAICILEDDAQGGMDHIDCHRSPALVISAYAPRGAHDSRFYNTDSMLRTMELLLGMPPMSAYDAVADPFDAFTATAQNNEPYDAILPKREILCEVNTKTAFRAQDSIAMLRRYGEDSMPDLELNAILWGDFQRHRAIHK